MAGASVGSVGRGVEGSGPVGSGGNEGLVILLG